MSLKQKILKLRKRGWSYRRIEEKLNCSRGTISYHIGLGVKDYQISRQSEYRVWSKLRLVKLAGGCCIICGYSKCLRALEFHHVNPAKKKFTIGNSRLFSFKKSVQEMKKCKLLCSNCHREVEEGITKLP